MHSHRCVYTRLIPFRLNKCSSTFPDHHPLCHIPHCCQPQLRSGFSKFIPACLEKLSFITPMLLVPRPPSTPSPFHALPSVSLPAVAGCSGSCSGMQEGFWGLCRLTDCCLACGFKRKGGVCILTRGFNYHSSWSSNLSHGSQA